MVVGRGSMRVLVARRVAVAGGGRGVLVAGRAVGGRIIDVAVGATLVEVEIAVCRISAVAVGLSTEVSVARGAVVSVEGAGARTVCWADTTPGPVPPATTVRAAFTLPDGVPPLAAIIAEAV